MQRPAFLGLSWEDWAYIGGAAGAATGVVLVVAAVRRRARTCTLDVYASVLEPHGVRSDVVARALAYAPVVHQAADHFGVSRALLMALVHTESRFDPAAGSSAGAVGLTQYIPSSAISRFRILYDAGQWPFDPVEVNRDPQAQAKFREAGVDGWLDRTDPAQAAWLGAAGMRSMLEKYGDAATALAVYNAGPSVANKPSSSWPSETRSYVPKVLERAAWYAEIEEACP